MHIQNCIHPRVIRNKYSGQEVVVSCGKCAACLNNHALLMTSRVDMETSCHKFAVFATLTYADYDVPQVVRLRVDDCQNKHDIVYLDSETGEFFDFYDPSIKRHRKKDVEYCYNTKVLPVLDKTDAQKFIKLVRYYARQSDKNSTIRYWITGEYGETTFRPHFHVILWFDSETLAREYKEIIYKSWKHGNVYDPHLIDGSASSYVASYVNGTVKLPSIYTHKKLKPFALFSKFPALGSLAKCVPSLQEFFNRNVTEMSFCGVGKSTFSDVPLWRSLLDRFCPRIQRFVELSRSDRITLYGLAQKYSFESPYDFADFLYFRFVRGNRIDFVSKYLYDICHYPKDVIKFSSNGAKWLNKVQIREYHTTEYRTCINSLIRFCTIINKANYNAASLGITLEDYVNKLSNYFDYVDKKKLKDWYQFQDEYFKNHPVRDFLLFDYAFVKRVNGREVECLDASDLHYLKLCGVVDDGTKIVHLSLDDCQEYHDFVHRHELLAASLVKKKVQFDYVLSQSDAYLNIKNYFTDE